MSYSKRIVLRSTPARAASTRCHDRGWRPCCLSAGCPLCSVVEMAGFRRPARGVLLARGGNRGPRGLRGAGFIDVAGALSTFKASATPVQLRRMAASSSIEMSEMRCIRLNGASSDQCFRSSYSDFQSGSSGPMTRNWPACVMVTDFAIQGVPARWDGMPVAFDTPTTTE